jgi:Kef-type K+ transport system membrane component KefB
MTLDAWQLLLLLAAAHALGSIAKLFKQPALLGHMAAGVILGPSMLGWINPALGTSSVADLALFFVVLTAGLELRIKDMSSLMRGAGALTLLLGLAIPALAATALVGALQMPLVGASVVVLCLSVTALPVALQILTAFGLLETAMARVAIMSAVICDIVVLMGLSLLMELSSHGDASMLRAAGVGLLQLSILIALVLAAYYGCEFISRRQLDQLNAESRIVHTLWRGGLAALMVVGLGVASARLGLHFVIGAFFGAMLLTRELMGTAHFERCERWSSRVTALAFGPLFLALQGVRFDIGSLQHLGFLLALLLVAVVSKLGAGYLMGRLKGMSAHDSLGVGIVMNARGVMEMVVASIAFRAGLVDRSLFSSLLIIGIVTSMLTPMFLKRWQSISELRRSRTVAAI